MKRTLLTLALACLVLTPGAGRPADDPREAFQSLQEFIGKWNGNGGPDKPRPTSKELWKETVNWGWRFKGDDAWLTVEMKDGKYFKKGELRYLADKKQYQLKLLDLKDKEMVFEGELKNNYLVVERTDAESKEVQKITMNTAGDGARFIYNFAHKREGSTLYVKDYTVACTKDGESLGKVEKKNECVVSGGLGTMPVTYMGETFYVCCSGCLDAFKENPKKYVDEFKAKKNKK
jgi:hypothetical protein